MHEKMNPQIPPTFPNNTSANYSYVDFIIVMTFCGFVVLYDVMIDEITRRHSSKAASRVLYSISKQEL